MVDFALPKRRAEATGFRNGMASVSKMSHLTETAVWLNHILDKLWRIEVASPKNSHPSYPVFVTRAFRDFNYPTHGFGGLEPAISAMVGAGIVKNLELAQALRPTDVAYASLYSLSLGRRPPVVRSVKIGNEVVQGHTTRVELDLDVDALMDEMSIVLGKFFISDLLNPLLRDILIFIR